MKSVVLGKPFGEWRVQLPNLLLAHLADPQDAMPGTN